MLARCFIGLLLLMGIASGCGDSRSNQDHEEANPEPGARDIAVVEASLEDAVANAARAYPAIAREATSYDEFRHGVVLRPGPAHKEGEPRKVGETADGEPIYRVEVKEPSVKGRILGITNSAGHLARMVADVLRLGADHDLLYVTGLLGEARLRSPMEEAFLLFALEEYKHADGGLLQEARRILANSPDNKYLLVAAMRLAARYGSQEDVQRVEKYMEHPDIDVRSAAHWAWTILGEQCVPNRGRILETSRYPPERTEDPRVRDALRQFRKKEFWGSSGDGSSGDVLRNNTD